MIVMLSTIPDVLTDVGNDPSYKDDWIRIYYVLEAFESFEFVFFAHLMVVILGYRNGLSQCLRKREQDILNAIRLVIGAKDKIQQLRSYDWDKFLGRVTLFCEEHGVKVTSLDDSYVPYGKSAKYARVKKNKQIMTTLDEKYILVSSIKFSQVLNNRFDEVNMDLLSCM
jgi:hypothetical protein